MTRSDDGNWVRHEDVEKLLDAVIDVLACKGQAIPQTKLDALREAVKRSH